MDQHDAGGSNIGEKYSSTKNHAHALDVKDGECLIRHSFFSLLLLSISYSGSNVFYFFLSTKFHLCSCLEI